MRLLLRQFHHREATSGGSVGTCPGPANKLLCETPAADNTNVKTSKRIAIFIISFLQFLPSELPKELPIEYRRI
jgi:hypothetical protein